MDREQVVVLSFIDGFVKIKGGHFFSPVRYLAATESGVNFRRKLLTPNLKVESQTSILLGRTSAILNNRAYVIIGRTFARGMALH